MMRYVAGRILHGAIVALGVVTLVFILLHLLPGSEAKAILGVRSTPAQWAVYNQQNGLDQPLPAQYLAFLANLAHGRIAFTPPGFADQISPIDGVAVDLDLSTLVTGPLVNSLILSGITLALVLALIVPISAYEARRRGRGSARALDLCAVALYSVPPFLVGTVLIWVFTTTFPILSLNAPDWITGDVLGDPPALILPVVTLAIGYVALFSRYLRASMLRELGADYVVAARAGGASPTRVIWRHVLRNALMPIITLIGTRLPQIFGAQLVVEFLFAYPGIGSTMWNAASGRDYYTMLGAMLLAAVVTVVGSLVADLLYGIADPRVRTKPA